MHEDFDETSIEVESLFLFTCYYVPFWKRNKEVERVRTIAKDFDLDDLNVVTEKKILFAFVIIKTFGRDARSFMKKVGKGWVIMRGNSKINV